MQNSMVRKSVLGLAAALFCLVSVQPLAAQCTQCGDPWINELFKKAHGRCPTGSGKNVGECDISRYGGGSWSSKTQLEGYIRNSKVCADPWVGEAVFEVTGRPATQAQCNTALYGGGRWSGYADLVSKVKAQNPALPLTLRTDLSLADATGKILYTAGALKLVDPAGIAVASSASIVANNGSRLIQDGGVYFRLLADSGTPLGTVKGADGKTYKVVKK